MGTHPIFESDFDCLTGMETEDVSTEEFSDVSQDREELIIKKENEKIEQIQEYKNKLKKLENDDLDELKKKWKRLESRTSNERKTLSAFKTYLLSSIDAEYRHELNEAESELEGKRDELRSKLLVDLEDKKKQLELEKTQSDISGSVIDGFEGTVSRRTLRVRKPREGSNSEPTINSNAQFGLQCGLILKRTNAASISLLELKRKRLGPALVQSLTEQEINDDLKIIKASSRKRSSTQNILPNKKEIAIRDGKMKIGQKWFYKHEHIILQRRDGLKENVKISSITDTVIEVKKDDSSRIRFSLGKISRGKVKFIKI